MLRDKLGSFQEEKLLGFLLMEQPGEGRCRLWSDVQSGSHQGLRGSWGRTIRRNAVSPLKKVFITKQILIKSGLVLHPTSG